MSGLGWVLWAVAIVLTVPLTLATNLLTPRVEKRLARRSGRLAERRAWRLQDRRELRREFAREFLATPMALTLYTVRRAALAAAAFAITGAAFSAASVILVLSPMDTTESQVVYGTLLFVSAGLYQVGYKTRHELHQLEEGVYDATREASSETAPEGDDAVAPTSDS